MKHKILLLEKKKPESLYVRPSLMLNDCIENCFIGTPYAWKRLRINKSVFIPAFVTYGRYEIKKV